MDANKSGMTLAQRLAGAIRGTTSDGISVLHTRLVFSPSLLSTAERADSRERVTLGNGFANKEVQLAVLEIDGDE